MVFVQLAREGACLWDTLFGRGLPGGLLMKTFAKVNRKPWIPTMVDRDLSIRLVSRLKLYCDDKPIYHGWTSGVAKCCIFSGCGYFTERHPQRSLFDCTGKEGRGGVRRQGVPIFSKLTWENSYPYDGQTRAMKRLRERVLCD